MFYRLEGLTLQEKTNLVVTTIEAHKHQLIGHFITITTNSIRIKELNF